MYQSEYSLVIYSVDPNVSIPQSQLTSTLSEANLLGKQESQGRYQVGDDFLSLFCFMGCSPSIELLPQANNQPYCYIEVPETSVDTQCIISTNVKVPRCPHCKADLIQLTGQLKKGGGLTANCHTCLHSIDPPNLNWRKSAVFAKSYIVIGNIYEAEAVPDPKLLDLLEQSTHTAWRYAYIRS